MRKKAVVPFGQWAPDQSLLSGNSATIKGCLSLSGRYAPLPDLEQIRPGSQISDDCIGGFTAYDPDGQPLTFIGDAGNLYRIVGKLPQTVSRPGAYNASRDWVWSFSQFGNNILAIARGEQLQRFVMGSSNQFEDVNTAPNGDCVFRIRNQVFIGAGNIVHACAFNNVLDWTPDTATQAFSNELNQARGLIVAGWGGEQGLVFQERGMTRLNFLGGEVPYQFDDVEGGRGLVGPNAWSEWGRQAFCVAEDGFYTTDGSSVQPIGQNRVDRWFASQLNYSARQKTWAAIDTERKSWMIGFPTGGSTSPNMVGIYSFADDRWTFDDFDSQYGLEMHREPVNIDDEAGLIALLGTADVDAMSVSFDSPAFRESRKSWGVVNGSRQICQFSGPARAATFSTGTFEPIVGRKAFVTELYPTVDAEADKVSGALAYRIKTLEQAETVSVATDQNEDGYCPQFVEGRYLRGIVNVDAGAAWTEALGVHTDASPSGER
jgi:hypothetical protein